MILPRESVLHAVEFLDKRVEDFLRSGGEPVSTAVVLGSGLGRLADSLRDARAVPYAEIPGFVGASAPGHAGRLVFGRLGNNKLAVMQGRLHFYEGHTMEQVTFPYRVLKRVGVKNLLLTSAVGGISPRLKPGSLMLVRDHINFMGENPLRGPHDSEFGERFPDMSEIYPADLRRLAQAAARRLRVPLAEGIYCAVRGPSYETPAEIRLFRKWGADVVGMSLVPEAVVANQEKMRVLAVACVSNKAAGLSKHPLSHEEVMQAGRKLESTLASLLSAIVEKI